MNSDKLIIVSIVIAWIVIAIVGAIMFGYDIRYAPTSDLCTSVRYNLIEHQFETDEGYLLYIHEDALKTYVLMHQGTPLHFTIRKGVFSDCIIDEKSYVRVDPNRPRRVPDGYTGKCGAS